MNTATATKEELLDVPKAPPAKTTTVKEYERKHRAEPTDAESDAPLRFDESVPVDEEVILPKEVIDLPEDQYDIIGQKVTLRLKQIPAQFRVHRTIRPTVKLKDKLHTAPAPEAVIERSFADSSLLAGLLTDKFCYHLPLYRQHQRMEAAGVHVSRAHLTKLTHRSLELLEPVYHAVSSMVLTSELVSMDETPIKAGTSKGKMKTAYFWVAYGGEQVVFFYSKSRGKSVVTNALSKGCKKFLSDGYGAYESYARDRKELVHAQCWAHVRRKFFEADASVELELIQKLFAVERADSLLEARRLESLPLVDEFFSRVRSKVYEEQVPLDDLYGKALKYALDREQSLRVYLADPEIPISNNHVEREIRPVALGRKNWLFCWSEVGARYAAIAFTLVNNCKLHGVDPWRYFNDVLQRISTHPAAKVDELVPKNWKNICQ